jgi:hypothetical protein
MPETINDSLGPIVASDPFSPQNMPVREPAKELDDLVKGAAEPVRNPDGTPLTAEQQGAAPPGRWELNVMRPRHREILRRVLEGATYVEIADQMGIHKQTVMLIATSPMFREELAKLESQLDYNIVQRADGLANEALDVIKTAMRSSRSEFLRVKSAREILDTAGYSKIDRKIVGIVTGEDVIRELNKKRREAFQAQMTDAGESGPED